MTVAGFVILSIICVIYCLWYCQRARRWIKTIDLIPGPKSNFFLGNISDDILRKPNKAAVAMRKYFIQYGPIVRFWGGWYPFVHVADAELAEVILSSNISIGKGVAYALLKPWLGEGLLTSTGNKWHRKRKILTPAFHFAMLDTFVDSFVRNSQILVDRLENEPTVENVDLVPYLSECTLDVICETAMGVEVNVQKGKSKEYLKAVHKMNKSLTDRLVNVFYHINCIHRFTTNYKTQNQTLKILHGMSTDVIKRRIMERQNMIRGTQGTTSEDDYDVTASGNRKRRSFIDIMLDFGVQGDQYSTIEDIREEVDTFMFEGHDTTSSALSWSIFLIGRHQDVQDKIVAELSNVFHGSNRPPTIKDLGELHYLDSVIKESLRLYPPVPVLGRTALQEIKFGEYTIPTGTDLVLHIHQIHRSPEYYENPNEFNPSNFTGDKTHKRNPFAYIPFSGGPRNCIGQRFALLQMKVILTSILKRFRVTSLQKEEEMSVISDLVLRPGNGVWVKLEKRNSD